MQLLDDAQIREVIAELMSRRSRLGIPTLRATLRARHGASCGTDRLGRLLAQYRQSQSMQRLRGPEAPVPRISNAGEAQLRKRLEVLEEALTEARAETVRERVRANLAEERERVHQDRWANEICELRSQLAQLRTSANPRLVQECESLRGENRYMKRLIADLRLALAEAGASREEGG